MDLPMHVRIHLKGGGSLTLRVDPEGMEEAHEQIITTIRDGGVLYGPASDVRERGFVVHSDNVLYVSVPLEGS